MPGESAKPKHNCARKKKTLLRRAFARSNPAKRARDAFIGAQIRFTTIIAAIAWFVLSGCSEDKNQLLLIVAALYLLGF